jgi:hypothetical protein
MDFTYQTYNGRLVLNPNDFILRFEHQQNGRTFEKCFFEQDFYQFEAFGGISFIQKTLSLALDDDDSSCPSEIETELEEDSKNEITLKLTYKLSVLPKPLIIPFNIPALRKQTASADVESMDRKIKDLTKMFEQSFSTLQNRISELEERCGDTIVLPGCDSAIPQYLKTLTLVKSGTEILENNVGYFYSSFFPGHKTKAISGQAIVTPLSPSQGSYQGSYYSHTTWEASPNSFVFHDLQSIQNLKYMKDISTLIISGCTSVTDFSELSSLTKLTSLSIIGSQKTTNWNPPTVTSNGNNPLLKDISWIKNLKNLQTVSFRGCSSLVDITPLKQLPNLKTLDIRETGVKNTDFLTNAGLAITK